MDGVSLIADPVTAGVIENAGAVTIYFTTFGPRAKLESGCSGG